ncbi:MAG: gliding motility-associated C-terminal domain-containing protein [Bacteroidia bacterium]|nr:gliding motility-associated C-terminal domain-containing protein [Bacteroidia bacterium]
MKRLFYCFIAISLSGFIFSTRVFSQCANDNTLWVDLTPPSCPGTNSTSCIFGGEYCTVSVVSGNTYTFQTCGDTDFDTQITTYNQGTGAQISYDDDGCGTFAGPSTITWTATFTGIVRVLVDKYYCVDQSTCMTLSVSCSPPLASYNHPTTGLQNTYLGACMVSTCNANYYDNGGAAGNYSDNINYIYRTFCPSQPGNCIRVTFTSFNTESGFDYLNILNGATQGSPSLGSFSGATSPGVLTSTDASGCLGFRFNSDGSVNASGWAATLSCVACSGGPTATEDNNCTAANSICGNTPVTGVATGPGLTSECNGCVISENYSNWYKIYIGTGGTLALTINPVVGSDDYDFSLWGPNVPCGSINSTAPVRCSYAEGAGSTGMGNGASDFSEDVLGDGWVATLAVSAGQYYYFMVNDWTPGGNGFEINASGSTAIFGVPPGSVTVQTNNTCPGQNAGSACAVINAGLPPYTFSWNTGQNTQCINNLTPGTYTVTVFDGSGCNSVASGTVGNFGSPSISFTVITNVNCFGQSTGAIDMTPSGGTPGYSYWWTGPFGFTASTQDISNRPAGTYNVTVTDANGCIATSSTTITQPAAALSGSTLITNVQCFGQSTGAIDLTPSGGTPGYSYLWNTGAVTQDLSNRPAGTYTVTITDSKGCTATVSATITQPGSAVSVTTTTTNVACFGQSTGSATANPSGGAGGYSYSWNTGANTQTITNRPAGTYTVTVTDANGCTATASATITQPPSGVSVTASQTSVSCFGGSNGSATANPAGGTPGYSYLWNTGANTQTITNRPAGTYTVTVTDAGGCTATASVTITQPPSGVTVTTTQTNVTCFGGSNGSATANPSGGTPGYSYLWNTGANTQTITNRPAGTYTVTVTDAGGCTGTASVTITQPASAVSVSITQTNVACFGGSTGSATANPAGGTPGYTYSWSTGAISQTITNLPAGTYFVTVFDANGCTSTGSVTVTQPASAVSASIVGTNVTFFGGSDGVANLTPSGGTPGYTYLWNTGAISQDLTNIPAGTYCVTVTDANGCTTSACITITQPGSPLTATIIGTNVTCNGGNNGIADLSVSGGVAPYTYLWSNSATSQDISGLTAGTYTVTVTDNNSVTTTASVTITQPTVLSSNIIATNVTCQGLSDGSADLTVSGGASPYSYLWNTGVTTQDISGLPEGTYCVTVTDANSCTASTCITITQPPKMNTTLTGTNVLCYGAATGATDLTVTGGIPPYTYLWNPGGATSQDLSNITAGTYSVTITDANACSNVVSINITQPASGISLTTSQTNVLCNGNSTGSATVNPSGGTPGYSYLWSTGAQTQGIASLPAGLYYVTVTDANSCTATTSVTITQPAVLSLITTGTDATCNGTCNGTATVTPSGGTAPYSYIWSNLQTTPTANNLCDGTYNITVTDFNGCTATDSQVINEPASITLSSTFTNSVCGGATGTIDLTVGGGIVPYTYLWSNGSTTQDISGLSAGAYTVTVSDNNSCTLTITANISDAGAPAATITSSTNVSCNGGSDGSATVTVSSGTSPYDYEWSTGASSMNDPLLTNTVNGLSAGNVSVTVTDALNCAANATVLITQPAVLNASITSFSNATCDGGANGSATVAANGGTPIYTYFWTGGQANAMAINLSAGIYGVTVTDAEGCTVTTSVTITDPDPVTATITGTDASCFGGSTGIANLTPGGGAAPYTYSWLPGGSTSQDLTNISAGIYNVTVTDANGCTGTGSITIGQPSAALAVTTSQNNVACFGNSTGSATATPTDGTSPYTYLWNVGPTTQTISNLSAGTYCVTITDANSCTTTACVTITQPAAALSVLTSQINVACSSDSTGSATANPTGGTPGYNYLWTGGVNTQTITGIPLGTYNVTVTDNNGCTATASVSITEPAPVTATIIGTGVSCFGGSNGSADLTPSGGIAPYTYLWSPGGSIGQDLNSITAGVYAVTVTDANGCTATSSVTITQPGAALSASITGSDVTTPGGDDGSADLTVSDGTIPYTFIWSNGESAEDIDSLSAGTYSVIVTDANGCTAAASVTINEPGAISAFISGTNVNCNGESTGEANLTFSGGTPPYTFLWSTGDTTEDLTNLAAGNYFVTVTDANNITATAAVSLNEPPLLTANITATDVTCQGGADGSAYLTVSGGTMPYSYDWSNGNTNPGLYGVPQGIYYVIVTDFKNCTVTDTVTITEPATGISIFSNITNIDCFNNSTGAADIVVSGGASPYSYLWSNGNTNEDLSNVQAGVYGVTVTDDYLCTSSSSVTITQPSSWFTAYIIKTNVSCNGSSDGIADLETSDGTAPFTYLWSDSSSSEDLLGIPPGIYSVTVTDANGCTAIASANITEPGVLTTGVTVYNVDCYGGSTGMIDLSVNGGTMPFYYEWSNGFNSQDLNNVPADTFYVTVTDVNNCSIIDIAIVDQPLSELTASLAGMNVLCYGNYTGSIELTVTGGTSPYMYYWNYGQTDEDLDSINASNNYSVTVVDANYCLATASVAITQPPVITTIMTTNEILCNGDSTGVVDLVVFGGVTPYSYLWNTFPPDTTTSVSNLPGGFYKVTVTDANGCIKVDSVTLLEPMELQIGELIVQDVNCYGESTGSIDISYVQGGRPAYSYSWNNGQSSSSISNVTAGIYMITVTDANGCTDMASDTLTEPDTSLSVSIVLPSVNCYFEYEAFINLTVSGGTQNDSIPYYNYLWNYGQTTEDIDSIGPGLYIVTITDANDCILDTSMSIFSKPHISLVKTDLTCYEMNNGTIIADVGGGNLPFNYLWSTNDTTPVITNLPVGTYSLTVTDVNNCADTALISLTQPDSLFAAIVVTDALCYGDSTGGINLSVFGGTIPYTYLWNSGHTSQDIMNVSSGIYTATVTDVNNCQVVCDSIIISQPTEPLALSFNVTNVTCYNGDDGAIDVTVTGGTPFYTYLWNYGYSTQDIDSLIAGEYEVTITDYYKCKLIDSMLIYQPEELSWSFPEPVPTACGDSTGSATFYEITGGTAPYTWLWSNGETDSVANNLYYGNHNISITDVNNCTATFEFSVNTQGQNNVIPYPVNQILCHGGLGSATVNMPAGIPPFTFLWNDGQTTQTADSLIEGSYSVTITDAIGCTGTASIIIVPAPLNLTLSATPVPVSCRDAGDGQVIMQGTGGVPYYSFTVVLADTSDTIVFQSVDVLSDTATLLLPTTAGYVVLMQDANGCPANSSVTITEPLYLEPGIPAIINVSCYGGNDGLIQMYPAGGNGSYQYLWSNGQFASVAMNLSSGIYYVTITDAKDCDTTMFISVSQPPLIVIEDSVVKTSCRDHHDGEIHLTITGGTGEYSFDWSDGQISNPATELVIGKYYVTVRDEYDCSMFDTIEVGYIQLECLTIPTAFTPNDDNYNDDWELLNIELYRQITIQVFNRWGDKVFESDGSGSEYDGKRWDGTYNGRKLPIGPYMYIIDLHNDLEPYAGTVTIIR